VTTADGMFVCRDADYAKEMAYLKEKVRLPVSADAALLAHTGVQPHSNSCCLPTLGLNLAAPIQRPAGTSDTQSSRNSHPHRRSTPVRR